MLFFAVNAAAVLCLYVAGWIEGDNFRAALETLASSYETYLGLIVAFYLSRAGQSDAAKPGDTRAGMPFVVALAGTLVWNAPISLLILRLLARMGTIEDSVKQIAFVGTRLSWLVAASIGYYFASPSEPSNAKSASIDAGEEFGADHGRS